MIRISKRGISPIVATALLISLALVLAVIVFLWAKAFIPEKMTKFDAPIEEACKSIGFDAGYADGILSVTNNANVPIYGIALMKKTTFTSTTIANYSGSDYEIVVGDTKTYDLSSVSEKLSPGFLVAPIVLGISTKTNEAKAYVCDDKYAQEVNI